jgi:hypothetical protein
MYSYNRSENKKIKLHMTYKNRTVKFYLIDTYDDQSYTNMYDFLRDVHTAYYIKFLLILVNIKNGDS